MDFSGKVAIITGASGNLGRAAGAAFQGAGAKTVLVDRSQQRLNASYPQLASSADHYLAGTVDLTSEDSVRGLVSETLQRFGRIDVLVNTVGGFRAGKPVHEDDPDDWLLLFRLNVLTALATSRAIVPQMIKQRSGAVINVGSPHGLAGMPRAGGYSVAKAGVIRLTEAMAEEVKDSGVHVHCVLPTTMDTPQNREAMPKADFSKWVEPAAVADTILFLASDAARALYGVIVPIHGPAGRT